MNQQSGVLIVHNHYQFQGGEDSVVANEKEMLEEKGHQVILYTRDNSELKNMSPLKKIISPIAMVFNLKTYREIKNIIRTEKIDIVHVHNTLCLISPSVYYAALSCHIPVVQTIHNFRLLCPGATFFRDGQICEDCVVKGLKCAIKHHCYRNNKLQTMICVISTKIHRMTKVYGKINYICLTEFNKEKLCSLKQIKRESVYVKPNFSYDSMEVLPKNHRREQFIFVGRIEDVKGIQLLFRVWKEMGKKAPNLLVCGTGSLESWCKAYIRENDLNIRMMGFVPKETALKLTGESKALILPTQWYEGFPMTIVEAFSVGTPVICPDMGNCGVLIEEGINGIKYHGDHLREAIEKCRGMFETTYGVYQKKYTKEINYKMLKNIYTGCMQR